MDNLEANAIETRVINGNTYAVFYNLNPDNPREFDDHMLGIIFSRHGKYDFNESDIDDSECNSWGDVEKLIKKNGGLFVTPLYLLDHSGISISTRDFRDRWDSGQIGYIYTTKENIKDIFGETPVQKGQIEAILQEEVKALDKYLREESYVCRVYSEEGELLESYWGFDDIEIAFVSALEDCGENE